MNVKKLIIGGIVGGIVDYLLGGLFYGALFPNIYPQSPEVKHEFILLGCLTFGFLVSYIFTQLASVSNAISGLKAGAIIGLLSGLYMNFFMYANQAVDYKLMLTDVGISVVMGAVVGAVVAFVNGKIK